MSSECVKVMVRCRPMNKLEQSKNSKLCVQTDSVNQMVTVFENNDKSLGREFTYDRVYGMESTQREVYDQCGFGLIESVLAGYNGTIFAYGQTGCGKTHTMVGVKGAQTQGIIPNSFDHIYGYIDDQGNNNKKFLVRCSYLEIYNEEIRDLLGPNNDQKLELKEDKDKGVFVKDLAILTVKSVKEIENLMAEGTKSRHVGKTAMNEQSSRSHSLFTIYIETAETVAGKQLFKAGKLNLVDLAGSERQSKTQAEGVRLKEATKINLSLSALGNVISALVDGKSQHIPFRDSKLTRLLQDSLGGNTKTIMIAAISPADYSYDETLSTLRYAARAKMIKNKPRVNEDPKDALLKQYEDEIKRLKAMLEGKEFPAAGPGQGAGGPGGSVPSVPSGMARQTSEETVDDLLAKLAKKGQKVQLLDEAAEQNKTAELQSQHQKEMQELQQMMKVMENQLVQGGNAISEKEKENAAHRREMQLKLQEEIAKQEELEREKAAKEAELLEKEQQYGSLQDEVTAQRMIIKKLRNKVKQQDRELKDINKETEGDRQDLLNTIREQAKDIGYLEGVLNMLLSKNEQAKIKSKVEFDFDSNKWVVPAFVFKNKEVSFPKIGNAMNLVAQSQEEREIECVDDPRRPKKNSFDGHSSGNRPTILRNEIKFASGESDLSPDRNPGPFITKQKTRKKFIENSMGSQDNFSPMSEEKHLSSRRDGKFSFDAPMSAFPARNNQMSQFDVRSNQKKNKYMSVDGGGEEQDSMMQPKQLNVKLQPLSHSKQNGGFEPQTLNRANESHPILTQHNDARIKLDKLNYIKPMDKALTAGQSYQQPKDGEIIDGKVMINGIGHPSGQKRPAFQPMQSSQMALLNFPSATTSTTHSLPKRSTIRQLNPIQK